MPIPSLAAFARLSVATTLFVSLVVLLAGTASPAHGGTHHDSGRERGPLDIHNAAVDQHRGTLTFSVSTAEAWSPRQLEARPSFDPAVPQDYLCLELARGDHDRRYCMAHPDPEGRTVMIGGAVNDAGEVHTYDRLPGARVSRHGHRAARISVDYKDAGLKPGAYRWRLQSGWDDPTCAPAPDPPTPRHPGKRRDDPPPEDRNPCTDAAPNHTFFQAHVVKPRIVGCTRDEDMFNTQGPGGKKEIALTFDDGPSSYTSHVIDILNHNNVHSTFFLIGENIPGRTSLLHKMLDGGHEIGNHSLHHETSGASSYSLHHTDELIRQASGFEPCLYRPPGGYVAASTSQTAWQMGMSNILWDVDPQDWRTPGAGAIYSTVVNNAHAGSIVLLHDGGGNRSGTVAALDDIIHTLKGRGYRLVTVTQLLGEHFRWVP